MTIPTAVTAAETQELQRLAQDRNVLEIGSLLGHSTIALARVAKHVVSVDPHEGYPSENPRPTLNRFIGNLRAAGVCDKVTVCVNTHDQVLGWLRPHFDLIFIDCTGEYGLTLNIMSETSTLLTVDGVMCVHDCGHPDWPGAMEAVKDYGRPYKLVERLAVIYPSMRAMYHAGENFPTREDT